MSEFLDEIKSIDFGTMGKGHWDDCQLYFPRKSVYGNWMWPWTSTVKYTHGILRIDSVGSVIRFKGMYWASHDFYMTKDEAVMAKIELTM